MSNYVQVGLRARILCSLTLIRWNFPTFHMHRGTETDIEGRHLTNARLEAGLCQREELLRVDGDERGEHVAHVLPGVDNRNGRLGEHLPVQTGKL